ncbi:MAG TPA: hydroxymethylpyrimidine/phosphomethylpyrimidine kinase [Gammaproteobacteria bacterium]|nr:hydroxymethylpyrimidine/phosphomethylpyrimidine kinase [Gammaproteobacteria bacterium]
MTKNHKPPVVLVIAGNDPSGGAGIAADLQAITALGTHPAPVISALTVQDTRNAYEVRAEESRFVAAQAETVLDDLPVAAIKLGLLGNAAIGEAVAQVLAARPTIPVILDPVLVAAGGAQLAEDELIAVYQRALFPRATLITPNALEARQLAPDATSADERATHLLAHGANAVLLKGGDEDTPDIHNALYGPNGFRKSWQWQRLPGQHHGSGCTLASAIAALVARGLSLADAVAQAQDYTWHALQQGWSLSIDGRGQNIPNRQFAAYDAAPTGS